MSKLITQSMPWHDQFINKTAAWLRKLPPFVVRALLAVDILMGINPLWAWWLLYRYTGKPYTCKQMIVAYIQSVRFCLYHIFHRNPATGFLKSDWFSPPQRQTTYQGDRHLHPANPCGTCNNCCTTHWRAREKRVNCPLLGENGCLSYQGIIWDYSSCGRYPFNQSSIDAYQCPRFVVQEQPIHPVPLPVYTGFNMRTRQQ